MSKLLLAASLLLAALSFSWSGQLLAGQERGGAAHIFDSPPPGSTLFTLSAMKGLQLWSDNGRHWSMPSGLPVGNLYTLVADPARPHRAYTTNGDLFETTDGGLTWSHLASPAAENGPAGLPLLVIEPDGEHLFAGGRRVLAYRLNAHTWTPWGVHWPVNMVPTDLLAGPGGTVYASVGAALYRCQGQHQPWRRLSIPGLNSAITAMALGPDGVTPYVATETADVWSVGRTVRSVGTPSLPLSTVVALQSDPIGADLYAATTTGLFVVHLPGEGDGGGWRPILAATLPLAALRLGQRGNSLLAVSRDGHVIKGLRSTSGQALVWHPLPAIHLGPSDQIFGALSGTEWQGMTLAARLPQVFSRRCLPDGPAPDQAFDICGPFRAFYLANGGSFVLSFPRSPATLSRNGRVVQTFGKARLVWTASRGVSLAPMGQVAAAKRHFPRPSAAEARTAEENGSVYLGGYYVDLRFYRFWRQYLDANGASIFGPPLSQVLLEKSSDGSGRLVPVQYFANARLEYHADGAAPTVELSYLR